MRTPFIIGNWKMHKTLAEARELVKSVREGIEGVKSVDVAICPSFTLLYPMAKAIAGSRIKLGAQNAHESNEGPFTGEVSVPMIKDTGARYVIIGHSERRTLYNESQHLLARKVRAVTNGGLSVIYCLGESLDERDAGQEIAVVERQLNEVVNRDVPPDRLVIAYEPVWAIGTGRTATPQQAQPMHAHIRRVLSDTYDPETAANLRILYGGSVNPGNAAELLSQPDIDGALVGGACLAAEDFVAIIKAAAAAAPSKA